jgi:hypothetical protein
MMEAVNTSETSVNLYQTTRRNNPEDSHLQDTPGLFEEEWSRGSSVSIVSDCGLDDRGSIPNRGRGLFF